MSKPIKKPRKTASSLDFKTTFTADRLDDILKDMRAERNVDGGEELMNNVVGLKKGESTSDADVLLNVFASLASKCMLVDSSYALSSLRNGTQDPREIIPGEIDPTIRGDLHVAFFGKLANLKFSSFLSNGEEAGSATEENFHNADIMPLTMNDPEEKALLWNIFGKSEGGIASILQHYQKNDDGSFKDLYQNEIVAELLSAICYDVVLDVTGDTKNLGSLLNLVGDDTVGALASDLDRRTHVLNTYFNHVLGGGGSKQYYLGTSHTYGNIGLSGAPSTLERIGTLGSKTVALRTEEDINYAPLEGHHGKLKTGDLTYITGPEQFIDRAIQKGDTEFKDFSSFIRDYTSAAKDFTGDILTLFPVVGGRNFSKPARLYPTGKLTPKSYAASIVERFCKNFDDCLDADFLFEKSILHMMLTCLGIRGGLTDQGSASINGVVGDNQNLGYGLHSRVFASSLFSELLDGDPIDFLVRYGEDVDYAFLDETSDGYNAAIALREQSRFYTTMVLHLFFTAICDISALNLKHSSGLGGNNHLALSKHYYKDWFTNNKWFTQTDSEFVTFDYTKNVSLDTVVTVGDEGKVTVTIPKADKFPLQDAFMLDQDYPRGVRFTAGSTLLREIFNEASLQNNASGDAIHPMSISESENNFRERYLDRLKIVKATPDPNPYDEINETWEWIDNQGRIGEIFNTTAIQRTFLWHTWFSFVMQDCLRFTIEPENEGGVNAGKLHISGYKGHVLGMIDGLRQAFGLRTAGRRTTDWVGYRQSYDRAFPRGVKLFERLNTRETMIKKNLVGILHHSLSLKIEKNKLVMTANADNATKKRAIAKKMLETNEVFANSLTTMNKTALSSLYRSYINTYKSTPGSLYSYEDTYNTNCLKIMYKVLTQPDYGLLKDEKKGNKTVLHVGIPNSMIEALSLRAYEDTQDRRYYKSPFVCINVYKKNHLNSKEILYPKTFVFDTLAYINDIKEDGDYVDHITNFQDTWSIDDIMSNIQTTRWTSPEEGAPASGKITSGWHAYYQRDASLGKDMLLNHLFDYSFKKYYKVLLGLDFDETGFLLSEDLPLNHRSISPGDYAGPELKNEYSNFLKYVVTRYPAVNVDPQLESEFFRVLEAIKQSPGFSFNNRMKRVIYPKKFDRVFSILINEKDFIIDPSVVDLQLGDIYLTGEPTFHRTSKISFSELKETSLPPSGGDVDPQETSKILANYQLGSDGEYPEAYTYYVSVSILPKTPE